MHTLKCCCTPSLLTETCIEKLFSIFLLNWYWILPKQDIHSAGVYIDGKYVRNLKWVQRKTTCKYGRKFIEIDKVLSLSFFFKMISNKDKSQNFDNIYIV